MAKCFILAKRNFKEMRRDPLSLLFCLGFPMAMLLLMQIIFVNLEFTPPNFEIQSYASGICVFGYAFTALFIALQITSDKNSSFIKRINVAPISRITYYLSYLLSALPMVLLQTVLFFLTALIFGFPFGANLFLSIIYLLPSAIFYICTGIALGCICKNEKQTGPISSVLISLVGVLGGVFTPVSAFKGGFATFINILPFSHSILIASELQYTGAACIYPHIIYLLCYTAAVIALTFAAEKLKSLKK